MLVSRDESRVTWRFGKQTTHFSLFYWTIQYAGPVQQTASEFVPRMKARVIKKEVHCDEAAWISIYRPHSLTQTLSQGYTRATANVTTVADVVIPAVTT